MATNTQNADWGRNRTGMNDEKLIENVRGWVEKTGLPLELAAKAAFKKAGFSVTHSSVYVDPESDKGREIDIVAHSRDPIGLVQIYFVIECKASSKPWVVLIDKAEFRHPASYSLGVISPNVLPALPTEWSTWREKLGVQLERMHSGGYAIRQAFSGEKDDAFSAAMGVLKASNAMLQRIGTATPRYTFAIPVIVVDAPIIQCSTDDAGALNFRETQYSEAHFTGYIPERAVASIRIVHRDSLAVFARACDDLAKLIKEALAPKVQEWVAQKRAEKRAATTGSSDNPG